MPSSEKGEPLNVALRNFTIRDGRGAATTQQTANCAMHLNLGKGPAGYHFALSSVMIRGYGSFSPGSYLTYYVSTFWSQDAYRTVRSPGLICFALMLAVGWLTTGLGNGYHEARL